MKPLLNLMFLPLEVMTSSLDVISGNPVTPIAALKVPKAVTIKGKIIEIGEDEIVVRDASGQIVVDLDHINVKAAKFKLSEIVSVKGYLDIDRDFDCFEIHREDGSVLKAVVS